MTAQKLIRKALRQAGLHAWLTPPRGADLFADLRNDLPHLRMKTVFDVGANVGQSALDYIKEFPAATIHCFEPMPDTMAELKANVGTSPRVKFYQIALGAEPGTAMMDPTDDSCTALISDAGTVKVEVATLDSLWSERINFLKIDAEGHDLEVLKGASRLLKERLIDVLQVEAGMSPRHDLHVRFEDLKAYLEPRGMELFSIIGQSRNFVPGAPYMQRADAVFISDAMIKQGSFRHWSGIKG